MARHPLEVAVQGGAVGFSLSLAVALAGGAHAEFALTRGLLAGTAVAAALLLATSLNQRPASADESRTDERQD